MAGSAAAAVSPPVSGEAEGRLSPTSVSEVTVESTGEAMTSQDKETVCKGASSPSNATRVFL